MKILKKPIFLLSLLIVFYLLSRVIALDLFPIFTDEAIYIRWAQIGKADAAWRFISLTDGKQPLFTWLNMLALNFFRDPLIAGRMVSVAAGLGTLVGLFFLGREIFKDTWVGLLAALAYLLYPFALVHDRMALMDSLVGTLIVWALLFQVLLVRKLRLDIALILGMIMGAGILTKSSGFFALYLLPFSLLLFDFKKKEMRKRLLLWLGLSLIAVVESQVLYSILRLSPFFHMVANKNTVFIYSFDEWLTHPWRFLYGNLRGLFDWFIGYFSWPLLGLLLFSLWGGKRAKEKLLLLIWLMSPFFALALFGKVLFPRFVFFMTLPVLPLIGLGLLRLEEILKKEIWLIIFSLGLFFLWLRADFQLLTNPYQASIPKADLGQYLNDWPAGGGIDEAIVLFEKEAKDKRILVVTEGTFGLLPYGLEIYLSGNPNIQIQGVWPLEKENLTFLSEEEEREVYLVLNQIQIAPDWPLTLMGKWQKGVGIAYLAVYRFETLDFLNDQDD